MTCTEQINQIIQKNNFRFNINFFGPSIMIYKNEISNINDKIIITISFYSVNYGIFFNLYGLDEPILFILMQASGNNDLEISNDIFLHCLFERYNICPSCGINIYQGVNYCGHCSTLIGGSNVENLLSIKFHEFIKNKKIANFSMDDIENIDHINFNIDNKYNHCTPMRGVDSEIYALSIFSNFIFINNVTDFMIINQEIFKLFDKRNKNTLSNFMNSTPFNSYNCVDLSYSLYLLRYMGMYNNLSTTINNNIINISIDLNHSYNISDLEEIFKPYGIIYNGKKTMSEYNTSNVIHGKASEMLEEYILFLTNKFKKSITIIKSGVHKLPSGANQLNIMFSLSSYKQITFVISRDIGIQDNMTLCMLVKEKESGKSKKINLFPLYDPGSLIYTIVKKNNHPYNLIEKCPKCDGNQSSCWYDSLNYKKYCIHCSVELNAEFKKKYVPWKQNK